MRRRPSARSRAAALLLVAGITSCHDRGAAAPRPLSPADAAQFAGTLESAAWQEEGSWPQFGHDPFHCGSTDVDLESAKLSPLWKFRPTTHVWPYREGHAVWSTPVAGTVEGRSLVIAGHYDRNVYAIDGTTGRKVWSFAPGDCVFASPALGLVAGRPCVYVAALNRSVYALDAATGRRIWVFETRPWTFTTSESFMSSPTLVRDGAGWTLLLGAWNSDRSTTSHAQSGEVVALDARTGVLRWRRRLASVPISSPAVATFEGRPTVFAAAHHGGLWALRLDDGAVLWQTLLNEQTRSSPSLAESGGFGRIFVGTRFHSLFAIDPLSGATVWRRQTGYWVDATPCWYREPDRTTVTVGSYDRAVHAFRASDGAPIWRRATGNFAYASTASALLGGRRVVAAMSWDEHVYLLDGADGEVLFKARSGPLIWSHAFQGDSLWASPVVASLAGRPALIVSGFDGTLVAYGPPQ